MKTLIKKSIALLAAGIFFSQTISANTGEKPNSTHISETSRLISQQLKFSGLSLPPNQEQKVNVVFTVNEKGKVNLVVANTDNEALRKAIEEQFLKLTLTKLVPDNAYSIQLNFKIQ